MNEVSGVGNVDDGVILFRRVGEDIIDENKNKNKNKRFIKRREEGMFILFVLLLHQIGLVSCF